MEKKVVFKSAWLPYALLAPQIAVTVIFFFWPAAQAVYYSFLLQDAFGLNTEFVWFRNFADLFKDSNYLASFKITAIFSILVAVTGISISLMLATMADRGRSRDRGRAVGVSLRAVDRCRHLFPAPNGRGLELDHRRRPGDAAGGDRGDLEADQLQLPLLPRRAAVD